MKRRHLTDSQKAVVGRRWKVYYSKIYTVGRPEKGGTSSTILDDKTRDKAGEIVGGKISKLKRGRPLKNTPYGAFNPTQENIATQLNIPIRNIQFVKEIEQKKPAAIKEY